MSQNIIAKNLETILKILFKKFNCKYRKSIYRELQNHPHYPSLAALEFVLRKEGIESLSLKTNLEQLKDQLPKPVLVHVTTNTDLFLLVSRIDNENVFIFDEHGNEKAELITTFLKMWNGVAMIFNTESISPREVKPLEKVQHYLDSIKKPFIFFSILLIVSFFFVSHLEYRNTPNYMFLLGATMGFAFSLLLLIQGFDEHNSIVKSICTTGSKKNPNCSSILNSKAAFFLGIFSWSDIGLVFFLSIFLINLISPSNASVSITIMASLAAFPYVFYSLTYQKFIARSWCRLCLGVQAAIAFLFFVSIYHFSIMQTNAIDLLNNGAAFLVIVTGIVATLALTRPVLKSYFAFKAVKPKYLWLKHNQSIKKSLFGSQHQVQTSASSPLVCGNPVGETTVTLIISPVCTPCMNELSSLLPMLETKKNTRVEFIFLTEKEEVAPLEFNLAVGLIEVYIIDSKSFMETLYAYVNGYPASRFNAKVLPDGLKQQAKKLFMEQVRWCVTNEIYSTPKIYIDGAELHWVYTAKDIDYMCS